MRFNSSFKEIKRVRLRCVSETNCGVSQGRDNVGLKNMGSRAEWEIKRDKERGDTDTTET